MIKKVPSEKAVKKTTATKQPAKKTVTAKSIKQTTITAHIDVGFGNTLYIRGEGGELSWEKGIPLKNRSPSEWEIMIKKATGTITFKLLINDEVWAEGENFSIPPGSKSVSSPVFSW